MSGVPIPAVQAEPTALEVLQSGQCSPGCLLGQETSHRCRCRCGGAFHGLVLARLQEDEAVNAT